MECGGFQAFTSLPWWVETTLTKYACPVVHTRIIWPRPDLRTTLVSGGWVMARSTPKGKTSASQYFIKLYGSQRPGNRPKFSHTFATFTEQNAQSGGPVARSISWLPRDGNINPFGPPEVGRNYSLDETLAWLDKAGSTMRWESPEAEIEQRLFDSAMERIQEFGGGTLQYVMIDNFAWRPHKASNCIHAITDLSLCLAELGMPFTGILHGIEASRFVYQYLFPFYVQAPALSQEDEALFDRLQNDHIHRAIVQSSLQTSLKQLTEHTEHE
jgi:hypothetical protein